MPDAKLFVDTIIYSTPTGDVSFPVSGITFSGRPDIETTTGIFTVIVTGSTITGSSGLFTSFSQTGSTFASFNYLSGGSTTGDSLIYTSGTFDYLNTNLLVNNASINNPIINVTTGIFATGTVSAPGIRFSGSTSDNTGFYSNGVNSLAVSITGLLTTSFNHVSGVSIHSQKSLSFFSSGEAQAIEIKAPSSIASNLSYTIPTGSPSSGQVVSTNGSGVLSWQSLGGGASYQEFTSNGTWTKPVGCTVVYVECIAGGAGGQAGTRTASGASNRDGGNGGQGAYPATGFFAAATISSQVTVTVGAGGSGGEAATSDSTATGSSGGAGGSSSFGSYVVTMLPNGRIPSINDYWGTQTNSWFGSGGAGRSTTGSTAGAAFFGGGGGGGGGYLASNNTVIAGGTGGIGFGIQKGDGTFRYTTSGSGGIAGTATGGNGASGTGVGDGGGGGGSSATTAGGSGGSGAFPGGGGGGGGASLNGFNSGPGGPGGNGVVRVYTW